MKKGFYIFYRCIFKIRMDFLDADPFLDADYLIV